MDKREECADREPGKGDTWRVGCFDLAPKFFLAFSISLSFSCDARDIDETHVAMVQPQP